MEVMSKSLNVKISEVREEERKKAALEREEAFKKIAIEHEAAIKAKDKALKKEAEK